jgi:hypothetical protein
MGVTSVLKWATSVVTHVLGKLRWGSISDRRRTPYDLELFFMLCLCLDLLGLQLSVWSFWHAEHSRCIIVPNSPAPSVHSNLDLECPMVLRRKGILTFWHRNMAFKF